MIGPKSLSLASIVLILTIIHESQKSSVQAAISPHVVIPEPKFSNKFFCQDDLIFKPYIKIYKGRREAVKTGRPEKVLGPGFHTDFVSSKLENAYICVNGM